MVKVKLLSNKDGIVRYSYRPEDDGRSGILSYDIEEDKITVEVKAEKDVGSFYRVPVLNMIRDSIDNLPIEKTLMWY